MKLTKAALLLAAITVTCGAIAAAGVPKFCMGCDFKGQRVGAADFSNGVYFGANFEAADLSGASFRGARLIGANFDKANLTAAAFDGADCLACNFSGAKIDGATFSGVRMAAANFSGFAARVDNAQLRNLLRGCIVCNFSKGKFTGYDLAQVPMLNVDFGHADLRQVRFDGAIMCWYDGVGSKRALACDDPLNAQTCTVLSDGEFRRDAGI